MLFKTRGIVLNYIKYKDSSIIVKIYTEAFGIQSYIVNNVRSKSVKPKIALYQPLNLLELVVYHKDTQPIHRISEIKINHLLQSIPYYFKKSCIALFLTELLGKCLKEEIPNSELFNFLQHSILTLDNLESSFENFHLQFLLNFSNYLGFAAVSGKELLNELSQWKVHRTEVRELLDLLINSSYTFPIQIRNEDRREILDILLKFYELNVEGFKELKSVEVLKDLMS